MSLILNSQKVTNNNKHLKKVEGYKSQNVDYNNNEVEDTSPNTTVYNKFCQL